MSNEKKAPAFIEKIKYFLTEPIKGSADAKKRQKEVLPYFLIPLAAAFVFIGLGMAIEPIKIVFDILGYVSLFFAFVFGWCLYKAISLKKKFAELECDKCKTVIKYSPEFTFDVTSRKFTITDSQVQNSKAGVDITVRGIEIIGVVIHAKCQSCGEPKTITKAFTTAHVEAYANGISALGAEIRIAQMKKAMQEAYDCGFKTSSIDLNKKIAPITAEKAVIDYFDEDGTAGKTPWGTVTKTKK